MEEFDEYSGKYLAVLDAIGDRFKVRWKAYFSEELWNTLKQLQDDGKQAEGIKLLPNSAHNVNLLGYRVFNPMLLQNEIDETTGAYRYTVQQDKKAIAMSYSFDADGVKILFSVTTENTELVSVFANNSQEVDTLAQYDGNLATRMSEAARQLFK